MYPMKYRIENRYQDGGWTDTGEHFDKYEDAFDRGFELARDSICNGMVRIVCIATGHACKTWSAGETAGKHNGLAKIGESFLVDRIDAKLIAESTPTDLRANAAFQVYGFAHDHGTREEKFKYAPGSADASIDYLPSLCGPDAWHKPSPPARHANPNNVVTRLEKSLPSQMQSYIINRDLVVDTIEELQRLRHYARQLEHIACSLPAHDGVTGQRARVDTARKATRVNWQAIHGANP